MSRFWDGRTDGRSDPTPRPAFAFDDAGKNIGVLGKSQLIHRYMAKAYKTKTFIQSYV